MSDVFAIGPETLQFLHDETSRVYRSFDNGPAPGSQADTELAVAEGREMVLTAMSQGAMLLEVTADQTTACQKTLSNAVQTIAPWTCARSAMESSALGCWLMDSTIGRELRIQRSFAFRYEGLSQQEKLLRASGEKAIVDAVCDRILKVEQDAIALGYPPVRDKKGRCVGIGQVMPTATELVRQCLHKEQEYRLFSAVAHAHFWALNNLSLKRAPVHAVPKPNGTTPTPTGPYLQKGLKRESVAFLVTDVMDSLARIVWIRFRLLGWQLDPLHEVLEKAYEKMRLNDSVRFWR